MNQWNSLLNVCAFAIVMLFCTTVNAALLVNGQSNFIAIDENNPLKVNNLSGEGTGGCVYGSDGYIYNTVRSSGLVYRYNLNGDFVDVYIEPGNGPIVGQTYEIKDVDFGPDGNLYITKRDHPDSPGGGVFRYNSTTGAYLDHFVSGIGQEGCSLNFSFVFGPDNNLYIGDCSPSGPMEVYRYNGITGEFIDVFISAGSGGLENVIEIAFGPDGNFYVSTSKKDSSNVGILRYDSNGNFIDQFISVDPDGLLRPFGFVFKGDLLYVVGIFPNSAGGPGVYRYDATTGNLIDKFVSYQGRGFLCFAPLQLEPPFPPIEVDIDVKPGSDPNSINISSAGVIPVAILSSVDFDAATVVPETVSLAGAMVKLVGKSGKYLCNTEDVNLDGLDDLVCQIYTADSFLEPGETNATLEAMTVDGFQLYGDDSIRIVPDFSDW